MKTLLYFGYIKEKGHYLWTRENCVITNRDALERLTGIRGVTDNFLNAIDDVYTPLITAQGAYKEFFVPPFRIVAWHDYTVDTRPGSNSALLGRGYESVIEMLKDAENQFPSVMNRQTAMLFPA